MKLDNLKIVRYGSDSEPFAHTVDPRRVQIRSRTLTCRATRSFDLWRFKLLTTCRNYAALSDSSFLVPIIKSPLFSEVVVAFPEQGTREALSGVLLGDNGAKPNQNRICELRGLRHKEGSCDLLPHPPAVLFPLLLRGMIISWV